MITLVLGGARSGKSAVAERLVLRHPGPLVYVATAHLEPGDADLAERVAAHRLRRDRRFTTLEAGPDLVETLDRTGDRPALLDALGPWLAGVGDFVATATRTGPALVEALGRRRAPTVVVSDEVGMGVHPETAVGRRFRDGLGLLNQQVAEAADVVLLVVAGRALRLDRLDDLADLADLDPPVSDPTDRAGG